MTYKTSISKHHYLALVGQMATALLSKSKIETANHDDFLDVIAGSLTASFLAVTQSLNTMQIAVEDWNNLEEDDE